jgi:predicted transcriptional regulator
LFARPKPCSIMTTLKDPNSTWYLSKLATATGTTYVYVTKLVSRLEKDGYLQVEPKGKKRMVKLTEKGLLVANAIADLNSRLDAK